MIAAWFLVNGLTETITISVHDKVLKSYSFHQWKNIYFIFLAFWLFKSWQMFTDECKFEDHMFCSTLEMKQYCWMSHVKNFLQGQTQGKKEKYDVGNIDLIPDIKPARKKHQRKVIQRFENLFLHSAVWLNTWFHWTG